MSSRGFPAIPSSADIMRGCRMFEQKLPRDYAYNVSAYYVSSFWGDPPKMADGVRVLMADWAKGFYRFGHLNTHELTATIKKNLRTLRRFHSRDITDLHPRDELLVKNLFEQFSRALGIEVAEQVRSGPVMAAKTLHLTALNFFPIWDRPIAVAHGCRRLDAYSYWTFCQYISDVTKALVGNPAIARWADGRHKSLVKLIDEYNYAKYTNEWL